MVKSVSKHGFVAVNSMANKTFLHNRVQKRKQVQTMATTATMIVVMAVAVMVVVAMVEIVMVETAMVEIAVKAVATTTTAANHKKDK